VTAALLAAALLTPDAPELPTLRPGMWADRRDRVWVECPSWPGWLRMVDDHTGRVLPARWPAFMAIAYHGPLREVKP
jgi:hypothetical protein